MTEVVRPEHGARFLFECTEATETGVVYRVTVVAPDAEHLYRAELEPRTGAVRMTLPDTARPEWFDGMVSAFLKTIAANHKDEPPHEWPKRLLRWRQK